MDNEIDLGQGMEGPEPGGLTQINPEKAADMAEPNYPELSMHNVPHEDLMNMPDEGIFQIHGKVTHKSVSTHHRTGKKHYSARMRVHSIKPVKHIKHEDHAKKHRDVQVGARLEEAGF
jgi:hypothetical protein